MARRQQRKRRGFAGTKTRKTSVLCENLEVTQWFERDRQHVAASTPAGRTVAEWWDDDVTSMVEDGFFRTRGFVSRGNPIDPRSVIEYLRDYGLCDRTRKR